MAELKFYRELPPMECLAGDTLGPFNVAVQNDGKSVNISGLTMRLIVARRSSPTVAVLVKECTATAAGFTVAITSEETADWNGAYQLHFALYDAAGLIYRKLAGEIWAHPVPKGGSA